MTADFSGKPRQRIGRLAFDHEHDHRLARALADSDADGLGTAHQRFPLPLQYLFDSHVIRNFKLAARRKRAGKQQDGHAGGQPCVAWRSRMCKRPPHPNQSPCWPVHGGRMYVGSVVNRNAQCGQDEIDVVAERYVEAARADAAREQQSDRVVVRIGHQRSGIAGLTEGASTRVGYAELVVEASDSGWGAGGA